MRFSPALLLYRLAWEPALVLARLLAGLEKGAGGNLWPKRWQLGRRLSGRADSASPGAPAVWMHAASLGECKGLWATARVTVEALARKENLSFVLTANTLEGYEFLAAQLRAAKTQTGGNSCGEWQVCLAPLDHPREVARFLRRHNVRALTLFEVELWPHFILASRRAGIPVFWISARFTQGASTRYGRFPGALRTLLGRITWTLAQTRADAAALSERGLGAVETGADLRGLYYLPPVSASSPRTETPPWESRAGIALVSFHEEELGAITPRLQSLGAPDVPVFVFPRKMDSLPGFLSALEPLGFERRSRNPQAPRQIVDAFGLVPKTLRRCRVAVIGGSFAPHGGHNLWEPLTAGTRMAIGPHRESQEYLAEKLAAAGLLETPLNADGLDWGALHDAPDPRAACRRFAETERAALEKSLERFHALLEMRVLSPDPAVH